MIKKSLSVGWLTLGLLASSLGAASAKQLWTAKLPGEAKWHKLTELGTLLVGTDSAILSYDPEGGKLLWTHPEFKKTNTRNAVDVLGTPLLICNTYDGMMNSKVTFTATQAKKASEGFSFYTTNGCKGHHGIMVQYADNLFTEFDFKMNYIHDLTVQGPNSAGNVFANGRGDELCLDHHRQAPNNNVFTQIDLGIGYRTWVSSGGGSLGNHSGGWETFWNLTGKQGQNYPPDDWGAPSMNFVGLTTSSTSTKDINGRWFEVINPASLVPQNLYEAQRQRIATVGYPPDKFNYWTGGTAAWSLAANWFESLPVAGNKLIFGAAGAGGLMLNNDLGGTAFEIGGITFNSTAPAYVLGDGTMVANAGKALILKGVVINNSAALQTINNPVYVSAGQTIDTQSGDISIKGIISGTGGLIKEGAGTLTLAANNTYSGETKVVTGILAVNGGSIVDSAKLIIVGGKVQVTGIETVASLFFDTVQQTYGTWGATGSGAEHINNTYFSGTGKILVAALSAPNVVSTWTGASSTDFTQVVNWASPGVGAFGGTSNSRWSINGPNRLIYTAAQGSTVNASTQRALVIGSGSNGSMEITGGTFAAASSNAQDIIGNTNSTGSLTINGGNFVGISALGLSLGNGGAPTTSVLNIINGTATFNTVLAFNARRTGGVGGATVNLDGGVFAAATLQFSSGATSTLNFNGGVYKALADTNFSSFTDIFIKNGGAQIDTNGFNFTVAQPLLTDLVSTGGGLTKKGSGRLTLSVANTYSGPTRIAAGSLTITNPGALGTTAGATEVNNDAQLELVGGITVTGETLTINGWGTPLGQGRGALRTPWDSGVNTWAGNLVIGSNNSGIGAGGYSTLVVSGVVSGGAGNQLCIRNGDATNGQTILSGDNTYDAPTENIIGNLTVGSLNSVLTNGVLGTLHRASSSLGAPTTVERGAIRIGNGYEVQTALVYVGAGEITDRQLTLINGNGAVVIDQSGSGLLKFTSAILNLSSASRVLTLMGSTNGQGEIAGAISDSGTNKISLNKMGTGTWTLSGANTYSGDTTIKAGILRQTTGSAFADSAAVRIAASGANLDLAFTGSDVVDRLYFGETLQVPGVWGAVSSSAKNKSNLITGSGLISVTRGAAVTGFSSWASTYGVTGGSNGDSDNDGIPNLAEYALALNPAGSDVSAGTMDGNVIKFTKRAEAVQNGDVLYLIETSTDLGSSTAWTVVTSLTDTSSEISYALPFISPKIFVRLRVILSP